MYACTAVSRHGLGGLLLLLVLTPAFYAWKMCAGISHQVLFCVLLLKV
jgi:hypothetical protein